MLIDKYQNSGLKDLLTFKVCLISGLGERTKFPYQSVVDHIIHDTFVKEYETEEVLSSEVLGTKLVLKCKQKKLTHLK